MVGIGFDFKKGNLLIFIGFDFKWGLAHAIDSYVENASFFGGFLENKNKA
jgi:hypothetical protein